MAVRYGRGWLGVDRGAHLAPRFGLHRFQAILLPAWGDEQKRSPTRRSDNACALSDPLPQRDLPSGEVDVGRALGSTANSSRAEVESGSVPREGWPRFARNAVHSRPEVHRFRPHISSCCSSRGVDFIAANRARAIAEGEDLQIVAPHIGLAIGELGVDAEPALPGRSYVLRPRSSRDRCLR